MNRLPSRTMRRLLYGNYRNLGVYVDARCNSQNYTVIYSEVDDFQDINKKRVLEGNLKYT